MKGRIRNLTTFEKLSNFIFTLHVFITVGVRQLRFSFPRSARERPGGRLYKLSFFKKLSLLKYGRGAWEQDQLRNS